MKKFKNSALTPPPIQEEDGSAYDVDALLKGIDEQFDRANALINSLASINQDFNKITTVIDGLQRRVDEIIEKVKTIDIQAKLSEESKIELDNYHKNYKERLEQQLSDHAIQIDELINNYQIKHEVLLETYLKKFDNKKGVWISIKIFWLIFILIGLLLSSTVWFIGQTLTK